MSDQPTELCGNEDCDKCYPLPRWRISEHRIQHITYEREIKAATAEAAMEIFEAGTAWPSSYDDRYGEVVQQDAAVVVQMTGIGDDHQADIDRRKLKYYATRECWNDPERHKLAEEFLSRGGDEEFSE